MPMSMSTTATVLEIIGSLYPSLVVEPHLADRMYPLKKRFAFLVEETGYMHIQASKPDTVGKEFNIIIILGKIRRLLELYLHQVSPLRPVLCIPQSERPSLTHRSIFWKTFLCCIIQYLVATPEPLAPSVICSGSNVSGTLPVMFIDSSDYVGNPDCPTDIFISNLNSQ